MTVFRIEKTENFTMLSNYLFRDFTLSWKAKGILANMLSLPDDWDYSVVGLSKLAADGLASTRSALKELEAHGYLIRKPVKENGKIVDWEYDIFEVSQEVELGISEKEKQEVEKTDVEKQTQLKIKESITKKARTKGSRTKESYASAEAAVFYPLDEKLNSALVDYIGHRRCIGKPMTEIAVQKIILKLDNMTSDNNEKIAILEQSIVNGWIGIFPLKKETEVREGKRGSAANDFFEIAEELAEEEGGFIL